MRGNLALDEHVRAAWVNANSNERGRDIICEFPQLGRILGDSQCMQVNDAEECLWTLHLRPGLYGPQNGPKRGLTRRLNSREYAHGVYFITCPSVTRLGCAASYWSLTASR